MPEQAWRRFERRVAEALGGRRGPALTGKATSDVLDVPYVVECKRTTRYSLRREWLDQARKEAKRRDVPWMLVISEHNDENPVAVVDFKWLADALAVSRG